MQTLVEEIEQQASELQLPANYKCRIPTDVLLLEAEELLHCTNQDKAELSPYGLAADAPQKMASLINLTREAHINMVNYRDQYQEEWSAFKPKLQQTYRDTIRSLKFALANNDSIQKKLVQFNKETNDLQISMCMEELALMVKDNHHHLQAKGIKHINAQALSQMSEKAFELRAYRKLSEQEQYLHIKNTYFYLLDTCMSEIRRVGQFVFRNQADKRKNYISKSIRTKNLKYRNRAK